MPGIHRAVCLPYLQFSQRAIIVNGLVNGMTETGGLLAAVAPLAVQLVAMSLHFVKTLVPVFWCHIYRALLVDWQSCRDSAARCNLDLPLLMLADSGAVPLICAAKAQERLGNGSWQL